MAQANIVPSSDTEDQLSNPSRASQEKSGSDEEAAHPSDYPNSFTKTLLSSEDECLICSNIPADEEPIIIFKTDKIQYKLSTESNTISHLQGRFGQDLLLCTLTNEEDVKEASLLPTDQLLILSRVRAYYEEEKRSFKSIYDLQYIVGLTFPNRPRSLWLFCDYYEIEGDEYGIFQLGSRQECDWYREAAAILEDKWDLGWICGVIGEFDLGQ